MSEADTIKVIIDDTDLDKAIMKVQQVVALTNEATNTGLGGRAGAKGLPGINRELRLILGQVPGMREAIQVYFRLSRMVRGYEAGNINLLLTVVATTILVLKQIQERQKRIERQQQEYDRWIMKERGLTKEGYDKLMKTWEIEFKRRAG